MEKITTIILNKKDMPVARESPGTGFPKNPDGTPVSQSTYEEFMAKLAQLGILNVGITAGHLPRKDDKVVTIERFT